MNINRECDGRWYSVDPGDRIVVKVWIKCEYRNDPSIYNGGRLGIDYYAGGLQVDSYPHDGAEHAASEVPWTTGNVWVQKSWDLIIPSTYFTRNYNTGATISARQVDEFVIWFDARPVDAVQRVWFADAELYINP
jgi:hypothetical protein